MDDRDHSHSAHRLTGVKQPAEKKREERRRKIRERAKTKARRYDTIGHLGPEAVVAYVDGEMENKSAHRVRVHLVHCEECRTEVREQRGASEWVRQCATTDDIRAPRDLMAKLAGIAHNASQECNPSGEVDGDHAGQKAQRPARGVRGSEQDIFDKIEMIMRAIKHNQRGA